MLHLKLYIFHKADFNQESRVQYFVACGSKVGS